MVTNLRDPESIYGCVEKTVEEFGRVDIVVNNAAILVPGDIETVQDRHIDLMWQVDMRGPVLMCKAAVPHMKAEGGHLINISSGAAISPGPGPYDDDGIGGLFYGMVKAGLERFTQGLAIDLQKYRIAANVLSLNYVIHTPGNIFAGNDPENPNLDFDSADWMGSRGGVDQPPARGVHGPHRVRPHDALLARGHRVASSARRCGPLPGLPGEAVRRLHVRVERVAEARDQRLRVHHRAEVRSTALRWGRTLTRARQLITAVSG